MNIKGTFFLGEGEIMKLQTVTISYTYDSIYNILLLLSIVETFAKHCLFKLRLIQIKNQYHDYFFVFTLMYVSFCEELTERETEYIG